MCYRPSKRRTREHTHKISSEDHTNIIKFKSLGSVDAANLIQSASIIGPKTLLRYSRRHSSRSRGSRNGSAFTSGVDSVHEGTPHLTASTDRNGRFSGYYRCSLCVAEFRPNPEHLGEMASFFAARVRLSHCDDEATARTESRIVERIEEEDRES